MKMEEALREWENRLVLVLVVTPETP